MAVQKDFELWSGDTLSVDIVVTDDDDNPIDLSTATNIVWTVRQTEGMAVAVMIKDFSTGIDVVSAFAGTYSVTFTELDTIGLAGIYYYDSVITDSVSGSLTDTFGHISIKPKGTPLSAYCSLEEALALASDLQVTDRSKPSLATCQVLVEMVANEIDGVLTGRGFSLPIINPEALRILKVVNQKGAIAGILKSRNPDIPATFLDFEKDYQIKLTMLANPTFDLLGTSRASGPDTQLEAGYYPRLNDPPDDSDPWWGREMIW